MSDTARIILLILILIIVYILTRRYHAWKLRLAYISIIKELKRQGAIDPSSAVELSYAKIGIFRFGAKDYRPKAVEHLTLSNIIGMTESGRYYLKNTKAKLSRL